MINAPLSRETSRVRVNLNPLFVAVVVPPNDPKACIMPATLSWILVFFQIASRDGWKLTSNGNFTRSILLIGSHLVMTTRRLAFTLICEQSWPESDGTNPALQKLQTV